MSLKLSGLKIIFIATSTIHSGTALFIQKRRLLIPSSVKIPRIKLADKENPEGIDRNRQVHLDKQKTPESQVNCKVHYYK